VRVLLDTSPVRRGPSGTAVYVEHLAPALRTIGVDVVECSRPPYHPGHGGPRSYVNALTELTWIHARLPRRARGADVLHHTLPALARRAPCPQVVTVHDLAFELLPDAFDPRFRAVARRRHRAAARGAAAVIVPSEATAADVRDTWGVDPERIVVAPHGPGQAPRPDRGEARHFLYVGDAEPRKNVPRLLEAHARYRADGGTLDLVLAGGAGAPVDAAQLAELHRHAAALVLPSLHEGFGLTALEAMHAGTPVLASRIPALTELCAGAARYCDPLDVASIAAGMSELSAVPPLREELRRRGVARAAAFSWESCARAHVRAYTLAAGLT